MRARDWSRTEQFNQSSFSGGRIEIGWNLKMLIDDDMIANSSNWRVRYISLKNCSQGLKKLWYAVYYIEKFVKNLPMLWVERVAHSVVTFIQNSANRNEGSDGCYESVRAIWWTKTKRKKTDKNQWRLDLPKRGGDLVMWRLAFCPRKWAFVWATQMTSSFGNILVW